MSFNRYIKSSMRHLFSNCLIITVICLIILMNKNLDYTPFKHCLWNPDPRMSLNEPSCRDLTNIINYSSICRCFMVILIAPLRSRTCCVLLLLHATSESSLWAGTHASLSAWSFCSAWRSAPKGTYWPILHHHKWHSGSLVCFFTSVDVC